MRAFAGGSGGRVPRTRRAELLASRLLASLLAAASLLLYSPSGVTAQQATPRPSPRQEKGRFRHDVHSSFVCTRCHATGTATVATDRRWCAECHHVERATQPCGQCHTSRSLPQTIRVTQTFAPTVEPAQERTFTFRHADHGSVSCRECHSGTPTIAFRRSCDDCHEAHHRPEATCARCHATPRQGAHTAAVHTRGCGGSGCHQGAAARYDEMEWTRNYCLVCHRDRTEHRPGKVCTRCHVIPRAGAAESGHRPGDRP